MFGTCNTSHPLPHYTPPRKWYQALSTVGKFAKYSDKLKNIKSKMTKEVPNLQDNNSIRKVNNILNNYVK